MLLTPRYDADPLISIEGPADDQREPFLRQRRRMDKALAELTDDQWQHPTRCVGWSVQDVIAHLIGTNRFWNASMQAGLAGTPTRFLAAFDPAATPNLMVEPMRSMTPKETLDQFVDSNRALYETVESLDDDGWSATAEAPPGHLPIRLLANHALWDGWVHERDILLPLGVPAAEEPDEISACLRYVAALGAGFALLTEPARVGTLVIDTTEPDVHLVIDASGSVTVHGGAAGPDAARLTGSAVDLVEMLSIRRPLDQRVAEDARWLLGGLAAVFDAN